MLQKLAHILPSFSQKVFILCCLFLVIMSVESSTQELSPVPSKNLRLHPDGAIGRMSFSTNVIYSSVTAERPYPEKDFQLLSVSLDYVPMTFMTLLNTFHFNYQDSLRYQYQPGIRFYLKNPLKHPRYANPDGPIWGAVLTVSGGVRFYGDADTYSSWLADANISVPVSHSLTIQTGYRYYEDRQLFDLVTAYGQMSIYTQQYVQDSTYVNPDGPIGNMVLRLLGGGSSYGGMGQVELLFPLEPSLTLTAVFRYERTVAPVRKALSAGVGISYYSK